MPNVAVVHGQQLQCSLNITSQELAYYSFVQLLPAMALYGAATAAAGVPAKLLKKAAAAAERHGRLVYGGKAVQHLQSHSAEELLQKLQSSRLGHVADCVSKLLYAVDENGLWSVNPVCMRWLAARFSSPDELLSYMVTEENIDPLLLATQWWLTAMVHNEVTKLAMDRACAEEGCLDGGSVLARRSSSSSKGMAGAQQRDTAGGSESSNGSLGSLIIQYKHWYLWAMRMEEALQRECNLQ
jgi:hypothetical protein